MRDRAAALNVQLPEALIDAVAERAAALIAQQDSGDLVESPWLSVEQAVVYTGIPKHSLYKLTAAKAIPHCKPGNRLLFNRIDLDAWINDSREGPVGASQLTAVGLRQIDG